MQPDRLSHTAERFSSIDAFAGAIHALDVGWTMESSAPGFGAALRHRAFDDCLFGEMLVDPCRGARSGVEIGQSAQDYLCLTYYRSGRQHFTQRGRELVAEQGEFVLWDAAEPSLFDCPVPMHCYAVWFPKRLAERRVGPLAAFLGQKAQRSDATTRLLTAHFRTLHRLVGELPDSARAPAIDASIELIVSCFLPQTLHEALPHKEQLLRRAHREIERRLGPDHVTPAVIADALGISVRYLHQIFSLSGTSFSTHAAGLRLEHAARALGSARNDDATLTDIAQRFGFSDSAHFTRSFKRRFGCTPSLYRAGQRPANAALTPP